MRVSEQKEYNGFILKKKGKRHIQIYYNGIFTAYTTTERNAKQIIDNRLKGDKL